MTSYRVYIKRLLVLVLLSAAVVFGADIPRYENVGALRCGWIRYGEDLIHTWCWEGIVYNSQTVRCNHIDYLPTTGEPTRTKCEHGPDKIEWTFTLNGTELMYDLTINGMSTLTVITQFLPTGEVGKQYSAQLVATGGTPPYIWSILSGELPPGLTLNTDGLISGMPIGVGSWPFTALVKDAGGIAALYPPVHDILTVVAMSTVP